MVKEIGFLSTMGVCLYIYKSIFIYILKPGMVQKLICHFSNEMLKIFCLRDTPSAWLT